MVIIEFAGIPGSGKSTICKRLQAMMKSAGGSVINMHTILPGNNVAQKIRRKIFTICALYSPLNKKLKRMLKNIKTKNDESEWIREFLLLNYRIYKECKNYDVILLDEGFVQYYTSIYHELQIADRNEIALIFGALCEEYRKNVLVCFLEIDTVTALERIKRRNRDGDRFLTEYDTKSLALLEEKKHNLYWTLESCTLKVNKYTVETESEIMMHHLIDEIRAHN